MLLLPTSSSFAVYNVIMHAAQSENAIKRYSNVNYRRTLFYLQTEVYLPIVLNIEENENICIFLNEEVLYC